MAGYICKMTIVTLEGHFLNHHLASSLKSSYQRQRVLPLKLFFFKHIYMI